MQVRFNGNGSCTVAMTASGLPTGAVASFSPSTLNGTSSGNLFTLLTVTTTNANVRLNGAVTLNSSLKIDTGAGAGDITFTAANGMPTSPPISHLF